MSTSTSRRFAFLFAALPAAAHAGQFSATLGNATTVTSGAWVANASAPYGRAINGNAFESDPLVTHNGYQYAAFWQATQGNASRVAVARRPVGAAQWQVMGLNGTSLQNGPNDAHNVVSLGISPNDGTIHLAYDLHGHNLRYRATTTDVLSNPASVNWSTQNANSLFAPERNWLVDAATPQTFVTYPVFTRDEAGALQLFHRTGGSGNGSNVAHDYDAQTQTWSNRRQFDDGAVGTYTGTSTANGTSRNAYAHGFTYGADGRLHSVFTWRESATGAANHDLNYVYSDDNGNVWKNNAGTVVANSATGQKVSLNSPGLVVRALGEDQTLMNQQGQAVDGANQIHALGWHRDSTKPNTGGPWRPAESSYFHNWRDSLGNWHEAKLPGNVGQRPKIFFDDADNAYAVYQVGLNGASAPNSLYVSNGELVIAAASKLSNWTDWKIVANHAGPFVSEAQAELVGNTLSVKMQASPTQSGNQGTALRVFDYDVALAAPTQRSLAQSGDWATAANWNGGVVPGSNTNPLVGAKRAVTVSTDVGPLDGQLWVGAFGAAGTLAVEAGGVLDLLHTGVYDSVHGGAIVVGRDGGSNGVYAQAGGAVSALRFAVGDYFSDTSGGGGQSRATVSGGTLVTHALEVGFAATGASGASFTTAGGSVTVHGDVVLGEFGNAAQLNLTGGTTTVLGNVREGFNRTNNGTLRFDGGTLDLTGGAVTLDSIEWTAGTLLNARSVNAGQPIVKATPGTMAFGGANTFSNALTVTAGALRALSPGALGTTAGNTTVAGGPVLTGRLELSNSIALNEPLALGGRQGAAALAPHVVNVAGNNALAAAVTTLVGGNQYTLQSDAGTLTLNGPFVNAASGTANDVRYLNLAGTGDGRVNSALADNASTNNPALTAVTKRGAGTWTLAGAATYDGATVVEAGTLRLLAAASANVLANPNGADVRGGRLELAYAAGASPAAQVRALLDAGYDQPTRFSSGQLRSTALAADEALGWLDDGTRVSIAPTVPGDFDLSLTVDFADLAALAANYGGADKVWAQGDADYDGAVGFADLSAVALNYDATNAVTGSFEGDWALALALTSVPEPANALALAGVAGAGLRGVRFSGPRPANAVR